MDPKTVKTNPKALKKKQPPMVFTEEQDIFICPVRTFLFVKEKLGEDNWGPFYNTPYRNNEVTKKRFS